MEDYRFGLGSGTEGTEGSNGSDGDNSDTRDSSDTSDNSDTIDSSDTGSASASQDDTGTQTGTDPVSCSQATHACVEPGVEGWEGPVAFYVGDAEDTPPACGGNFPISGPNAFTGLEVPASTCECGCGPALGVTCAGTSAVWYHGSSSSCESPTASYINVWNNCTNMAEVFGNRYWRFDSSGLIVAGGSCEVIPVVDVPPVVLGARIIICGGADDDGGCDSGSQCLPRPAAPFDESLCLYREGDTLCPSGSAYSDRRVFFTSNTDNRACALCTCSTPAGSCADSYATLESLAGCTSVSQTLATLPGTGDCVLSSSLSSAFAIELHRVAQASCTASQGKLLGLAQATNPVTVCCLAP
jgi:hypothetical protein